MPDELIIEGSDALIIDSVSGDTLLVEETITTGQYWTDFREYRRGRFPDDWTQHWNLEGSYRIEGAFVDLNHRNVLRLQGGGARSALTWDIVDSEPSRADQEEMFLFRWTETANNRSIGLLRVSGTAASPNAYRLNLSMVTSPQIIIDKLVAGVATSLATSVNTSVKFGAWIWCKFQVIGSDLKAKVWLDGDTEPVAWTIETTDAGASLSDGSIGIGWVQADEIGEIKYFAAAIGGASTENYSDVIAANPPLDSWIGNYNDDLEITARVEYYNSITDQVESVWVSNQGRATDRFSFPSNIVMQPLIIDPGSLSAKLEADTYFGGSSLPNLDPIRLDNKPVTTNGAGPLDAWLDYSFFGRPVEIRIGRRWQTKPSPTTDGILSSHRRFEIVSCGISSQEPTVTAEEASLPLGPPNQILADRVNVYRNVGISTGVKSLGTSGWLSIPSSTAYDIGSFVIYFRVLIPVAGLPGTDTFCTLSRRRTSGTQIQWEIILHSENSNAPSKIQLMTFDTLGNQLCSAITADGYNLGRFVDVIWGVDSSRKWYAYVDNKKVGGGTIATTPYIATGQIVGVLRETATNITICDHRIERFVEEEEALSRFSSRKDPDQLNISMHRCDDNTGNTITDYNTTTANHGTLQGTDAVDRSWVATYLGSSELANVSQPFSAGVIYHAPTQQIDSVRQIFRYNDRAKTTGSGLEIRAKGLLLTGGGVSYSEPTDGPGTIDIVGAADEPITFGLVASPSSPEDERIHVLRLIKDELINRDNLSAALCDQDSFLALRKLIPARGGFHYDSPPTIAQFMNDIISPTGNYYNLDTSGRLYVSSINSTINPGPYGNDKLLEFMGYPNQGVVIPSHSSYSLTQQSTWGLTCWFKLHRTPIDPSTSSSFTYFPTGMAIIDRVSGATGYYFGIDGRDGKLIFGAPGITSASTGLHYVKLDHELKPDIWYMVNCVNAVGIRGINMYQLDGKQIFTTESTDVTFLADAVGAPILIGHGPRGSFIGSIAYVVGASGSHTGDYFATWLDTRPSLGDEVGGDNNTVDRFWLELREGKGDLALEQVTGRYCRIAGCRWAPREILDFTSSVTPQLPFAKRQIPLWRAEGRYKENRSVLSGANVAAGVSATDRLSLGLPYLAETDSSPDTKSKYLNSRDLSAQTPYLSSVDADRLIHILRSRLSSARKTSNALNWYREVLRLSITDEVIVYDNRWYGTEGHPMRIITWLARINELRGDLGLWG